MLTKLFTDLTNIIHAHTYIHIGCMYVCLYVEVLIIQDISQMLSNLLTELREQTTTSVVQIFGSQQSEIKIY